MILQASNGCLLTQSEEVAIKERRFEKYILVASMAEASRWKEIPESEKDKILAQGNLFEPDRVDYEYLGKVDRLMSAIKDKINDAGLSSNEALAMKQYYPEWSMCIGKEVFVGFRCVHQDTLVEVVTPHIISADKPPVISPAPMLLSSASPEGNSSLGDIDPNFSVNPSSDTDIDPVFSVQPISYFKPVMPEGIGHADPVGELGDDGSKFLNK